jgi:hypothetical protein
MAKSTVIAAFLLASGVGGIAYAQDNNNLIAPERNKPTPGQLLDKDYTTSTGATVPNPGVPQGSGPTALDRKIQQEDNKIDNSICKGC